MINLKNLTFAYGKSTVAAITDSNATIGPGIHLLLGENGAGKTTLLHLISGLRRPTSGSCLIDGEEPSSRTPEVMQRVFFYSDDIQIPGTTINEYAGRHACFFPNFDAQMLRSNLEAFGMTGDEKLKNLSLGSRRKAQLAYAISLQTDLLLLDEPANGLDITAKQTLQKFLAANISEHQTVIISTHTVADLINLYDGLIVITRGKLITAIQTQQLSECIAFITSPLPLPHSLYCEQTLGKFRSIVPASAVDEPTDIDYTLLYNALLSPACDSIIKLINRPSTEE